MNHIGSLMLVTANRHFQNDTFKRDKEISVTTRLYIVNDNTNEQTQYFGHEHCNECMCLKLAVWFTCAPLGV